MVSGLGTSTNVEDGAGLTGSVANGEVEAGSEVVSGSVLATVCSSVAVVSVELEGSPVVVVSVGSCDTVVSGLVETVVCSGEVDSAFSTVVVTGAVTPEADHVSKSGSPIDTSVITRELSAVCT